MFGIIKTENLYFCLINTITKKELLPYGGIHYTFSSDKPLVTFAYKTSENAYVDVFTKEVIFYITAYGIDAESTIVCESKLYDTDKKYINKNSLAQIIREYNYELHNDSKKQKIK